jgi:hypothetical protein
LTKTISSVSSVAITFIVTLILNFFVNFYSNDRGVISVSSPVKIGEATLVVVTIENQSKSVLSGLVLEVPSTISLETVSSEPALSLEEISSSSKGLSRLVSISQVRPGHVSRIYFRQTSPGTSAIRISNPDASGLKIREDDNLESPLRTAFFSALFMAFVYACVQAVFSYDIFKRQKALSQQASDLKERHTRETAENGEKLEVIQQELRQTRALITKQRLLLQARLQDYSIELTFWRNSVRSFFLRSSADSKEAEKLIETVTSQLKTHGTRAETERNFESLRLAANWLADAEKSIDDKK